MQFLSLLHFQASQVCLDQPIRPQSLISDDLEIQPKYENKFLHAVYHPSMPDHCRAPLNAALLAECDNSGSLYSIQSAPVVQTTTLGTTGESTLNRDIPGGTLLPIDPMGVDAILDRQRDSYPGATGPLISPLHCNTLPKEDHRTDTLLRPSSLAFDTGYHVVKPHGKIRLIVQALWS